MTWKNREKNIYPKVLLSDCFVTKINIKDSVIILEFSEYGFFMLDEEKNNYFRTNGGQLRIEDCNIDDVSIEEVRTQKLNESTFFKTMYDIEMNDFVRNINSKKWRFEIVEEFYAGGSGFFTGMIGPEEDKSWCYIKVYFKNLVYQWNDIIYDWPY